MPARSHLGRTRRSSHPARLAPPRLTDETLAGAVWFFHHDWHRAHNGVEVHIPFRVYRCDQEAPA